MADTTDLVQTLRAFGEEHCLAHQAAETIERQQKVIDSLWSIIRMPDPAHLSGCTQAAE